MLRIRRRRNIQILTFLLLVFGLSFLFFYDGALPSPSRPQKTKYDSRATYEHHSAYRQYANHTFEHSLDTQLQRLEQFTLSSQEVKANLTIRQIVDPTSTKQFATWITQWRTNNPGWDHDLFTTHSMSLLPFFSEISSIPRTYETHPALQPDLMKYMMLWYHGGFYTDIDSWERASLKDCRPIVEAQGREVGLMVGVERDEPFFSYAEIKERGWTRGFRFGTGTLWAPKRFDPVLRRAIVRSLSHAYVQQTLTRGDGWLASFKGTNELGEEERGEISGAGMFTDIVLEVLSEGLNDGHELRDRNAGLSRRVSWKKFKGLKSVLWIESNQAKDGVAMRGIAVLPINIWSNGQNHSCSGTFEAEEACVNHFYGEPTKKKDWYRRLWQ